MDKKKCFKCGIEKELSEFYVHPQMADGYLNKCKECNKKDVQENYELRREYYREYDRKRNKKEKRLQLRRNYHIENNEKIKTHQLVHQAIKKGNIIKPENCQICGLHTKFLDAHHHDYTKPLDVIFVCRKCHLNIHSGNITF